VSVSGSSFESKVLFGLEGSKTALAVTIAKAHCDMNKRQEGRFIFNVCWE